MNKKIIIFLLFIFGLIGSYRLFRQGYFSMQDDMHVFRLEQLDKCLSDGQFPCRYIQQGGYGYGYPLYNFYSPFPYYFSLAFHYLGLSYIDSIKLFFTLTSFIRPIGIFLFVSALFGSAAGVTSSAIFSLAPYQATNSFVRGALAENFALAIVPFIFWAFYTKRYLLFSFFIFVLSLSHNLTLLWTLPLLTVFIFTHLKFKSYSYIKFLLLGLLMSSFFIIPAFFEKKFTTVDTMTQGYFSFVNHFATISQLFFDRSWGYGASLWGPKDDMAFQVGYIQWLLPIISLFIIRNQLTRFFLIIGFFFLFLTHNKSGFLWDNSTFLPYFQFPWRFIGPAVLCFSIAAAPLFQKYKKFTIPVIVILILLNFNYFKEDIWYPDLKDSDRFTKSEVIRQSGAGLKDYWPKYSTDFPTEFASDPQVLSGIVQINSFSKTSNFASGNIQVNSSSALISLPIAYFPKFELIVNNQPQNFLIDKKTGLITLVLNSGQNIFQLTFVDTPIRFISNILSIVSLIIFGLLLFFRVKK